MKKNWQQCIRIRVLWVGLRTVFIIAILLPIYLFHATKNCNGQNNFPLHDCSDNLTAYCRVVAEKNHSDVVSNATKESSRCLVLCRTNGDSIEFGITRPTSVIMGPNHRFVLSYASWEDAEMAIRLLKDQTGVLYAEHDTDVVACLLDEEPQESFPSFHSYGAEQIHLGGYLKLSQNYGTGNQTVAVIDSGVCTHSDLRGKMKTYGYDYVDADDDPTNDLSGHGTHVAGIIADCTKDTDVWIYPIRVLNRTGSGKMSNVVCAVLEATEVGVDVINLSLESYEVSEALDDAIRAAVLQGVTVVVAAGNSGRDTSDVCPAHLKDEGVIVVGAVEVIGDVFSCADYSNYGDSIDLYTFGSNIESCSRSGGYIAQSGTSMSAAHVSGICALMGLTQKGLSPQIIEKRLKEVCFGDSICVPDLTGFVPVDEGFSLTSIQMDLGDTLKLPLNAKPLTSCAGIEWNSSDDAIAFVTPDGLLCAKTAGEVKLTARCIGFEDAYITLVVSEEVNSVLSLPKDVTVIEDEAFMGTGSREIVIPDGVAYIGNRAFADCYRLKRITLPASAQAIGTSILEHSEQVIVLCPPQSMVKTYSEEHDLQYIIVDE